MKIAVCLLALSAVTLTCRASDISDLAAGYASAFAAMDRVSINLTCVDAGQTIVIKDVKLVKSFGGALLIRRTNGDQMVLSAASVLKLTE
jgi:hypothetical protein